MAAPKGNQFWKLRSVHGRSKLFTSPDLMMEAAQEYFNWVDAHPLYKAEAIMSGKEAGRIVKIPVGRPYTLIGFLIYIDASESFWKEFKKAGHEDFLPVISTIEKIIYTQKFEGAAIGAFNANIISRDLGLREKTELMGEGGGPIRTKSEVPVSKIDYTKLSDDVLEAIANARIDTSK